MGSLSAEEAAFVRPLVSDIRPPISSLRPPVSRTWKLSVATLFAANTADILSSRSLQNRGIGHETNSMFCDTQGRFSTGKAVAVKGGLAAGAAVLEAVVMRKWPRTARYLAVLNFTQAGVAAGSTVSNWRLGR
jgi:hypothetical protein